jgi:hypothetical protein
MTTCSIWFFIQAAPQIAFMLSSSDRQQNVLVPITHSRKLIWIVTQKIVLTIIAMALVWISLKDTQVISNAFVGHVIITYIMCTNTQLSSQSAPKLKPIIKIQDIKESYDRKNPIQQPFRSA